MFVVPDGVFATLGVVEVTEKLRAHVWEKVLARGIEGLHAKSHVMASKRDAVFHTTECLQCRDVAEALEIEAMHVK